MSYSKLLMKCVAESGYTSKQIIEECEKRGKKIDKAYMSKLLNGKVKPPSEELSRILASICKVDERLLVLEGYIEKAPKEIREAFFSIKTMTIFQALNFFENSMDKEVIEELKEVMNSEPISDFIINLIDNNKNSNVISKNLIKFNIDDFNVKVSFTEPVGISVKDESMIPIIPKDSKVILKIEDKYKDGDILAIKIKNQDDDIYIRYALFINDDIIVLKALNNIFDILKLKLNEIIILGKVTRIIRDI